MKNEITQRNILIVAFSLLMFLIVSILVSSYYNRKNLEINLINISEILNNQISEMQTEEELFSLVNQYTKSNNWLRISIFNTHGKIIYDSHTDDYSLYLDQNQMKYINSIVPKPYIKYSPIIHEKMLYYGVILNDDIIVRTSVPLTDNSGILLSGIFFMSILIVFVVLLSIVYTKKTADNVMSAFTLTIESLKNINEGKNSPICSTHKYIEVEQVLTEINDINEKISSSFLEVVNERDKMNFILDNINQGILIVDSKGIIIIINNKVKDILDLNDNLINQKSNQCLNVSELNEIIHKTMETKTPTSIDYYNKLDDKIYSFNASTINKDWISGEANFSGVVVLISDVTEERKNSQIKDEFIANASHELKTPITSISGFSELISSGMIKDEKIILNYIERISNETIKMKRVIDNLLSLSTLDSTKTCEDDVYINIKDVVLDVVNSYNYMLEKAKVAVTIECEDAYMMANPQLIYHLISNLIDNAIKYNRPGGHILLSLKNELYNISLIVEDSGIGIEKKNLDRIFARFYRIENSRSRLTGGSGLGLSIVKKICSLYDAHINVESQIDVGTKVTITFR